MRHVRALFRSLARLFRSLVDPLESRIRGHDVLLARALGIARQAAFWRARNNPLHVYKRENRRGNSFQVVRARFYLPGNSRADAVRHSRLVAVHRQFLRDARRRRW